MSPKTTVTFKEGQYRDIRHTQALLKVGKWAVASCMIYPKDYGFCLSGFSVYGEDDYRKGYGSMLLQGIVNSCKGVIKLEVLSDNIAAIGLYKKFGFCFNGETNKNLLTMIKENK